MRGGRSERGSGPGRGGRLREVDDISEVARHQLGGGRERVGKRSEMVD